MREPLTYAIARTAADAALHAARAEGAHVCVVVVNRSGITKVQLSDDGVGLIGVETARRKAYTAAVTGMPTARFAAFAASSAMAAAPVHLVDAQLLPVIGGLPITADDGEVIGAVGVGGADGETDERLAGRALEALKDLLA
ncbi:MULTISPECIES: heme-binding protein [unclassified Streptomyces]|uniref:GlcG/HbpS family heme-binding protein n=1 Tax=unclassified Streptomyces TaxID=2593676 RepID=UPI002250F02D|nr:MULTISPECIES: heme-binding protein [unclassified Streptomyces]MCX4641963.1 heme-binding protein [Streptomyces sp. NBC_01446]MCX5085698.1 heme-binding protein [Streptomyces sp. NBC_00401]MCX5326837.1 heme-binding protein [Streptomyces sp. NBC_00120]